MPPNPYHPYNIPSTDSKSTMEWNRIVHLNDQLGTVSKTEMIAIHSLVRRHFRVLMCRESNSSAIPPSLSEAEQRGLVERFPLDSRTPNGASLPVIDVTDFVKTGHHLNSDDFAAVELDLMRWGIRRFSFNWEVNVDDRVNQLLLILFWNSFYRSVKTRAYNYTVDKNLLTHEIIMPVVKTQFNNLRSAYHKQINSSEILNYHRMVNDKKKACKEYLDYLYKAGVSENIVSIFQPRNYFIMGNIAEVEVIGSQRKVEEVLVVIPRWWSEKTVRLMEVIEARVNSHANWRNSFPGSSCVPRKYVKGHSIEYGFIPHHLPADLYSKEFKDSLLPNEIWELKMKAVVLPDVAHMERIFPASEADFVNQVNGSTKDEYYPSDDNISVNELDLIDTDTDQNLTKSDNTELKRVELLLREQISTLKEDLEKSQNVLAGFKDNILDVMPSRLTELAEAREDIKKLNEKIDELQVQLGLTKTTSSTGQMDSNPVV